MMQNYWYLPGFSVFDHAEELRFHQLSIKVGNGIFKGVFIALLAFTLVTTSFESSAQDWYTLKLALNFQSIFIVAPHIQLGQPNFFLENWDKLHSEVLAKM